MNKTIAIAQAPAFEMQDYRERRVSLEEARVLQQEGKMVKVGDALYFRCSYIIHWRPNTALPEINQYATVQPA